MKGDKLNDIKNTVILTNNQYLYYFPLELNRSSVIVNTKWLIKPTKSGIPNELIHRAYDHFQDLIVKLPEKKSPKLKVVSISNKGGDEELYFLTKIISLFNKLTSIDKAIFCETNAIPYLKSIANAGIQLIASNEAIIIETDLVLCFGSGAIHFLLQSVPVIIIGTYGFGGWVCLENFELLMQKGFLGRPGGSFNEEIPIKLLADEIIEIQNNKLIKKQSLQLAMKVKKLQFIDYGTMCQLKTTTNVNEYLTNKPLNINFSILQFFLTLHRELCQSLV